MSHRTMRHLGRPRTFGSKATSAGHRATSLYPDGGRGLLPYRPLGAISILGQNICCGQNRCIRCPHLIHRFARIGLPLPTNKPGRKTRSVCFTNAAFAGAEACNGLQWVPALSVKTSSSSWTGGAVRFSSATGARRCHFFCHDRFL
jgi:hypothetical protein